nr:hypothetical protein [Tanacetum cinerariifolium]
MMDDLELTRMNELTPKEEDLGSFVLPSIIGNLTQNMNFKAERCGNGRSGYFVIWAGYFEANSRELQKMTKEKGCGGEGLFMKGRSYQRAFEKGMSEGLDYMVDFKEYEGGNVLLVDGRECHVRRTKGFTVKIQSGRIKVIKGSLVVLSRTTRRANYVYTMDSHAVTSDKEYIERVGSTNGVAGIQQQNGLVKETNMTLLAKVLQGIEFEVEALGDHGFEVEPQGINTQHRHYWYREDSNKAAFVVAKVEKIYGHESLTLVIQFLVRGQSGNTLRVSQSKFYNEKLVLALLEGHSILSLEGSLSGDCDVEKNDIAPINYESSFPTPLISGGQWRVYRELLLHIIKKLEAGGSSWPAREYVLACAAVCRGEPMQCFIRRDQAAHTYRLYLGLSPRTISKGVSLIHEEGSREVYVCGTHGVFSPLQLRRYQAVFSMKEVDLLHKVKYHFYHGIRSGLGPEEAKANYKFLRFN